MNKFYFLLVVFCFVFMGCPDDAGNNNALIGSWSIDVDDVTLITTFTQSRYSVAVSGAPNQNLTCDYTATDTSFSLSNCVYSDGTSESDYTAEYSISGDVLTLTSTTTNSDGEEVEIINQYTRV